ncbi:Long chain acyl-CoA synthetase 5-like protein [Drosera capensis]
MAKEVEEKGEASNDDLELVGSETEPFKPVVVKVEDLKPAIAGHTLVGLGVGLRLRRFSRCAIHGANCSQWIMNMELQACNAQGILCVAVEFIIGHVDVSIAFVEETRIPELLKALPNTKEYLKTIEIWSGGNATFLTVIELKILGRYNK